MPPVLPRNPRSNPQITNPAGVAVHDDHPAAGMPTGQPKPTTPQGTGAWQTLIPAGANRQTPQGIRLTQQWLNKHGAHLIVDGIWGPRSANAYNQFAKRTNLPTPPKTVKPPAAAPPASGGRAPAGGGGANPGAGGGGGGGGNNQTQNPLPGLNTVNIGGHSIPDLIAQIMKGNPVNTPPAINPQHVDPGAFGAMLAQLQYGPAIQQLQTQQGQVQGALDPTLQNIDQSFGRAQGLAQQGALSNQATAQQMQGQQDNTAQALAQAIGGNPAIAASLGQSADVTKGLLAQQAASQGALDQANIGDVGLQQANARTQAVNSTNQNLDNLRSQLLSTIQQRALATGTNAVQGMQLNDQFRSNAINDTAQQDNTALAQALAGPQVTASRLQNLTNSSGLLEQLNQDRFNAGVTNHNLTLQDQTRADAHDQQVFNQHLQTLQATWQQQDRNRANNPVPFYKVVQDPKTSGDLHNLVWSSGLVNQQGQLGVNPQQAYSSIYNRLKTMFPNADMSRLTSYAKNEVQTAINSGQNYTAWKFKGGKWVKPTTVGGTANA